MDRNRKAGVLMLIAAAAFLIGGLLNDAHQPLTFVAAGAMLLAAVHRLWRSRRT
jgi:hypothetical protein